MESATCCGMELRRSRVWNHPEGMYGIKPQGDAYTRLRVIPYAFGDSIQCASALIPCQACCLDKKITSEPFGSDVIFFGDPYGNRTHDSTLRGWRLSRLTNGPSAFTDYIRTSSVCQEIFIFFSCEIVFFCYNRKRNAKRSEKMGIECGLVPEGGLRDRKI